MDEEADTESGEGDKGTPDSHALASPTLKKEKDIKREKDIKKEIKTEHRDQAHRTKDAKVAESELVRDLKAQLKYEFYQKFNLILQKLDITMLINLIFFYFIERL